MYVWEDCLFIYFLIYILIMVGLKLIAHKNNVSLLFFSIMYLYILVILKYTIFPIPYDEISAEVFGRGVPWSERIRIIPFVMNSKVTFSKSMLLNILLTIPLGFGVNFLSNRILTLKKILLTSCLSGVVIELSQLIISINLGFAYRVIDTTDIICNFLGCAVGYILFIIFSKLWILVLKDIRIDTGIYKEIDCICKNTIILKPINNK